MHLRRGALQIMMSLLFCAGCRQQERPPLRTDALSQNIYVWQREWSTAVTNALIIHQTSFQKCIVLNAEISWEKEGPHVAIVPLNYVAMRQMQTPYGLALRIGGYSGPFETNAPAFRIIRSTAAAIIARSGAEKVPVSELHLDFDCPDSRLEGYAIWLRALKNSFPEVSLSITALPSWLRRKAAFNEVLMPLSCYVLQVHSLERPKSVIDPISLCDPDGARKAVEAAVRFPKPFLVSLPTYSYLLAFDQRGNFAGLQAESAAHFKGTNFTVRAARSSPRDMARLVAAWSEVSPELMRGIIWYRLPVSTDSLNWSWTTLETVMRGIEPAPDLKVEVRSVKSALYEVFLKNAGTDEYTGPASVAIRYGDGTVVASDGLASFRITDRAQHQLELQSPTSIAPLVPHSERKIAWIRTAKPLEGSFETQFSTH